LHLRMVEAIYAAWRLRQLADLIGGDRICEVSGGAGLTAYYAGKFGLTDYRLVDTPAMNAVQAYVLGGTATGRDMTLTGEPEQEGGVHIGPTGGLDGLIPGSIDILFNEDALPEMADAPAILLQARRLSVPTIFSLNQEAIAAGASPHPSVRALVQEAGGYRLAQRQRHGIRPGFVEELFRLH